ncbi:MAG: hypothetical protein ACFBSD_10490 [Paracoccaceae bacterium]
MSFAERGAGVDDFRLPQQGSEGGLEPVKARVRQALDTMIGATQAVRHHAPALSARLRGPLGRLVGAGQVRDAFDQRISHIETAIDRAGTLGGVEAAAALTVVGAQLLEIVALLEKTAETAAAAFVQIDAAATEKVELLGCEASHRIGEIVRDGQRAAAALNSLGERLAAEAAAHSALVDRGIPTDAMTNVDLSWMMALYTMDEERRVHLRALARSIGGI